MTAINPHHFALVTPFLLLCMAMMCLLVWRNHRSHRYLIWMAASQAALSIGLTSQTLHRTHSPYISALWISALYLLGAFWMNLAMHARLQQRLHRAPPVAVALACLVGMWVFLEPLPSRAGCITVISLGASGMLLSGARTLLRAPKRHQLDRVLLALHLSTGVCALLRPLLLLVPQQAAAALPNYDLAWWFAMLVILVFFIGKSVCMVGCTLLDALHTLRYERDHDSLTGLLNRRAFEDACGAMPYASGVRVVVLCDIDFFKHINDQHGHAVGDEVLRQFARVLRSHLREGDVVARIGGEEFAIALPHQDCAQALHMVERIAHTVLPQVVWSERVDGRLRVTASWGVVRLRPYESLEQALHRADLQLYAAKDSGRNCVRSETP